MSLKDWIKGRMSAFDAAARPFAPPRRAHHPDTVLGGVVSRAEAAIQAHVRTLAPKAGVFSFGAIDIDPRHLAIWVTTPTDAERDGLARDLGLQETLRRLLGAEGYPAEALQSVGFAFESE